MKTRTQSVAVPLRVSFVLCAVIPFFTPVMAMLANDPPVPLIAVTARVAVSIKVSDSVAFPLRNDVSVSLVAALPDHLGSNQSAPKSKSDMIRTNRRAEQ